MLPARRASLAGKCRGQTVAVKVPVRQNLTPKQLEEFRHEVAIMKRCGVSVLCCARLCSLRALVYTRCCAARARRVRYFAACVGVVLRACVRACWWLLVDARRAQYFPPECRAVFGEVPSLVVVVVRSFRFVLQCTHTGRMHGTWQVHARDRVLRWRCETNVLCVLFVSD